MLGGEGPDRDKISRTAPFTSMPILSGKDLSVAISLFAISATVKLCASGSPLYDQYRPRAIHLHQLITGPNRSRDIDIRGEMARFISTIPHSLPFVR